MSRRTNLISYICTTALMLASLFVVVNVCNTNYAELDLGVAVLILAGGALISGFLNTLLHELGHYFAGKRNGFVFSSMTVWFLRWSKIKNKVRFNFTLIGDEAGYTEMIPTTVDNVEKGLKSMARGGYITSLVLAIIGVPALFVPNISVYLYSFWTMLFPIGVYFFCSSCFPSSTYGARNDGAVVLGIKRGDDSTKVAINVLKIQAELYNGKTPCEIEEDLYFNLPQLPEDDLNFALLLNARYLYFLDKEDFENAKKVTARLLSITDYMPKEYAYSVKVDALYNACTFDFDEQIADDLVYELEKYLNNVNNSTNVRAKLAYLLYVKREKENADIFYKKGVKEANKGQIKGLALFERKLLDKMKEDF